MRQEGASFVVIKVRIRAETGWAGGEAASEKLGVWTGGTIQSDSRVALPFVPRLHRPEVLRTQGLAEHTGYPEGTAVNHSTVQYRSAVHHSTIG